MKSRFSPTMSFWIIALALAIATPAIFAGCKKIDTRQKNRTKVKVDVVEIAGKNNNKLAAGVSTEEMEMIFPETYKTTEELAILISETAPSTAEFSGSTSETVADPNSTPEKTIEHEIVLTYYARNACKFLEIVDGDLREKKERVIYPGESFKILKKILIKGRKLHKEAYYVIDKRGEKGYIYTINICEYRVCLARERWGVVKELSQDLKFEKRIPQIRIKVQNLFEEPIKEVHIIADFFYKRQFIGRDGESPASSMLGKPPMATGSSEAVLLRIPFDLPAGEELTGENPIDVRVHCSVDFGAYKSCGDFKIDYMYY